MLGMFAGEIIMKKPKLKRRSGFIVIMKDNTPSSVTSKLMEEVLKNKYVKSLEGTLQLEERKNEKSKIPKTV
jgi:hypothetical protein